EDAQRDVFPIRGPPRDRAQPGLGQPGEPFEIALPEPAGRLAPVAGLQGVDPVGDGILAICGHEATSRIVARVDVSPGSSIGTWGSVARWDVGAGLSIGTWL